MPLPVPAARLSTAYSKVHPSTTEVAVLEKLEGLDAVEASLKNLCSGVGGDNSENADCEVDVAESPTSPSTRNGRPFKGPALAP